MLNTLIVPGLDGSGSGHWQRDWAENDDAAEIVEQEDWARPDLVGWLHTLESRIVAAPGAVIVAHSLGCALVAHLAGRPAAAHVAGALLVAPAETLRLADQRPDLAEFRLPVLSRLPFPSILAASRNDPYLSWPEAQAHAAGWGSALVDLGRAGHVNTQSGFGPWPDARILADGLRGERPGRARFWRGRGGAHGVPGHGHDVGLGLN